MRKLNIQGTEVSFSEKGDKEYLSLTDIAKYRNPEDPRLVINQWIRTKDVISFLGVWETMNNTDFNRVEFDTVKNEAGYQYFTMSPSKWIELTKAKGITVKAGRYDSGTFAHKDIAFEFASWVSVEFKLYLITEFQRLKLEEQKLIGWSAKRELAKINYRIHTDSVKENLIPAELTVKECAFVYASEADIINKALFRMTANDWRLINPDRGGNIRDDATVEQLLVLANLESLNAEFIRMELPTHERIKKLNEAAINQMKSLVEYGTAERVNSWTEKGLLAVAKKSKK